MKFPTTAKVAAAIMAASAPVIAWAQDEFEWTAPKVLAVSAVTATTVALVAFIVEHLRKETPSRWVGVIGLLVAEVPAIGALGVAFAWWSDDASAKLSSAIIAAISFVATLLGVNLVQEKVTSPETMRSEIAVAQASGRRGGDGTGIPPQ